MPRDLHRKPFNDATLVKLELIRAYIVAWLSVFVKSGRLTKRRIHIFDLFCGPGADSAGNKGSPLLILEALQGKAESIQKVGYAFLLEQGFLMKHANPVLRRLKAEGRIDGDITSIEYASLDRPNPIRVLKK